MVWWPASMDWVAIEDQIRDLKEKEEVEKQGEQGAGVGGASSGLWPLKVSEQLSLAVASLRLVEK
ncbi:hypothetical protein FH972_017797 [Carpinus fangiana]|uniref:Uncharacterized protein n=1 Tax=Carpinus fangiana TaxID=176857 RepID=A0A5N6RKI1_9ROSI|nr:hypothetical protein FH972_017797 [Carpinus fangiana]